MHTWIQLGSIADLGQLEKEIDPEYGPARIVKTLSEGLSTAIAAVLIERNYIDKDYRSTYYHFYSKKGQTYRSDCVRLHFFDASVHFDPDRLTLTGPDSRLSDHYFGYMVLRPTGVCTIGRSVLTPDVRNGALGTTVIAKHKVHLLGYRLEIDGFPSMDQHRDISVCAHATCWSILRHYSERYSNYREYLTHDITVMAHQFNPGGLVPSKGLAVSNAERIFQNAGTYPVIVTRDDDDDAPFYRQLLAYVESGFPLFAAMHKIGHAITVVGYEWQHLQKSRRGKFRYAWDGVKWLVIVDDNALPYLTLPVQKVGKKCSAQDIDTFIVALPEKVFYSAEAVDELVLAMFKLAPLISLPPQERTIARYFMATGSGLRRFMRERESEYDPKLLRTVMTLPFAQYVWIIEFATQEDWAKNQISVRAVIDATASTHDRLPFWLVHNRQVALVFDRSRVAAGAAAISTLPLSGMQNTSLTRWDQNLRRIVTRTHPPKIPTAGGRS